MKSIVSRIVKGSVLPVVLVVVSGCSTIRPLQTEAAKMSGYTYVPVDPFTVQTAKKLTNKELFEFLPDNAVRISVEQLDSSGSLTYGPASVGVAGESYRVTVDYINADTRNLSVLITKFARGLDGEMKTFPLRSHYLGNYVQGTDVIKVEREGADSLARSPFSEKYNIPVYIGIGLRVTADVKVLKGRLNISGLGIIGAEAEASNLSGALTVQTLGVNGKSIAAALPIQSELNRTTAQNAIVAVGAIKALLYNEETTVAPRVVGIYLPFEADKQLVNAIISELSQKAIVWDIESRATTL